jgi:hypothetical protein
LGQFWREISAASKEAFCVTNGQFFYMPESPTRLAFPLKVDGQVLTDGWGIKQYTDQKLMLEIWDDRADITPLSKEALYGSSAPNIIAGLTEEANKRAKVAVGRTFVGIGDQDGDGIYETVMMINTSIAKQVNVADVLRSFGADKVMMLDGGGSTQLICKGTSFISSNRPIPQAIAVLSAAPPPVTATLLQNTFWVVTLEGENVRLEINVRNSGNAAWQPDQNQLVLQESPIGGEQIMLYDNVIQPGETVTLTLKLAAYSQKGLFPVKLNWYITHAGKKYYSAPIELHTVVLPAGMEDQRPGLQAQIDQWEQQPEANVEELVQGWLKEHGATAPKLEQAMISLRNLAWVPLLILPLALLVLAIALKIRR